MCRLEERLEQFCSELPGLKIIDSGAVSQVQLSGTPIRTKRKRWCRHDAWSFARRIVDVC